MKPHLTFFCQLETPVLQALFSVPDIAYLGELDASVSLGILDLSPERAEVVQRLNESGIPVIAWLLLPKEQGYWFSVDNYHLANERYLDFLAWTQEYGLKWAGIGLDIEPDVSFIEEFQRLSVSRSRILLKILRQVFDRRRLTRAHRVYHELILRMKEGGYRVDTYQFPFIVDERKSSSTLLQRAVGMVDLPVDREVLMILTSFLRPYGPGFIWSYAPDSTSIGIGSTGGGVDLGVLETRPLSWKELARDLRLAWVYSNDIHIFSLEGCIRQGFLAKLKDFEWDQPIIDPEEMTAQVNAWRAGLQSALWISGHPLPILGGIAGILFVIWKLRRRK